MAGYLNQNGNSIGSLLRFIQEQKSQSPILPQGSEVGSPIRDVVQQPLKGSEGIGTSRVVSIRPEGTLTPTGSPIQQGTPQASRIGPLSIGGPSGVVPPVSVVAANEPGRGFTIPSASRTAGDVVTRNGAASGTPVTPSSPSLGTSIKASSPVSNYNIVKNKQKEDVTSAATSEAIARGERSTADTLSRGQDLTKQYESLSGELTADINQTKLSRAAIAYAQNPSHENYVAYQDAKAAVGPVAPKATPTPAPSQPSQGGSSGSSPSPQGQVQGATTSQPQKSTLATTLTQSPTSVISKAAAPTVQKVQQAAQQAAQKIAPIITQSPWSWLLSKFK